MDIYLLERLHKLLHGPINVFDREGNLIHSFEEGVCQPVAPREFQGKEKKNHILKWMERAWHTQSSNRL